MCGGAQGTKVRGFLEKSQLVSSGTVAVLVQEQQYEPAFPFPDRYSLKSLHLFCLNSDFCQLLWQGYLHYDGIQKGINVLCPWGVGCNPPGISCWSFVQALPTAGLGLCVGDLWISAAAGMPALPGV